MKSNSKMMIAGVCGTAAALAIMSSYTVTKNLVKIALDREAPKRIQKTGRKIAGSAGDNGFSDALKESAQNLLQKEHEIVDIISYDNQKLIGHWFPCPDAKRVIIAMHGWRSSFAKDFGMISEFWFSHNCSVLFAEQRGQNNSAGDYMGFGMIERYDCLKWIDWVNSRCDGKLPIYLCGVSMGATTVLMTTGLPLPENVHGVIADCGFTSPYAIWKHVANKNLHISFALKGILANQLCRRKIQMGASDYSTIEALKSCTVPVMLIHGSDDHFVPLEMSFQNYKACAGPKTLFVVPGAGHAMSYYFEKEKYEAVLLDFWKKYDA